MRTHDSSFLSPAVKLLVICGMVVLTYTWLSGDVPHFFRKTELETPAAAGGDKNSASSTVTVEVTDSQLRTFKVEPAAIRSFRIEKEAPGSIAYHEKEITGAPANGVFKFAVANVTESDTPFIRVGQPVEAKMLVYPDQVFHGKISAVGVTVYDSGGGNPAIDPNIHRTAVRCEIADAENGLYPGMLATITVELQPPMESVAVAQNGVVREGDGTMTVWVTTDHRHFEKRIVKTGLRQDGYAQILDGLKPGELVATDNAIFLSNMADADSHGSD